MGGLFGVILFSISSPMGRKGYLSSHGPRYLSAGIYLLLSISVQFGLLRLQLCTVLQVTLALCLGRSLVVTRQLLAARAIRTVFHAQSFAGFFVHGVWIPITVNHNWGLRPPVILPRFKAVVRLHLLMVVTARCVRLRVRHRCSVQGLMLRRRCSRPVPLWAHTIPCLA